MALLPIGPQETQESMFEESTGFPESDAYEPEEFIDTETGSEIGPDSERTELPIEPGIAYAHPNSETLAESGNLPLTIDDFSALEERVLRAVNLVRRERLARSAAEERAIKAETQLLEQVSLHEKVTQLQQEVDALRQEREQVRHRVERLLSQLDALEL